jgi:hypothetical protein
VPFGGSSAAWALARYGVAFGFLQKHQNARSIAARPRSPSIHGGGSDDTKIFSQNHETKKETLHGHDQVQQPDLPES